MSYVCACGCVCPCLQKVYLASRLQNMRQRLLAEGLGSKNNEMMREVSDQVYSMQCVSACRHSCMRGGHVCSLPCAPTDARIGRSMRMVCVCVCVSHADFPAAKGAQH